MRARARCGRGPFRINPVPQGMLKPYILRLLSERPMHGFEIMEEIFERTEGAWTPGPSAIYPALAWLEERGYIELEEQEGKVRGEKSRRAYKLTEKGRRALEEFEGFREEWLRCVSMLRDMWRRATQPSRSSTTALGGLLLYRRPAS